MSIWQFEDAVKLRNPDSVDAALDRIQADLSMLAHTDIHRTPLRVSYAIRRARWWMGGQPFDMTDSGTFSIDPDNGVLSVSVSMKRTVQEMMILITAAMIVLWFYSGASLTRAIMYWMMMFIVLWGGNYFRRRSAIADYLWTVAQAA